MINLCLLPWLIFVAVGAVWAGDTGLSLVARYQALRAQLERNDFGVPLVVESAEEGALRRGELYGVLAHSFDRVAEALRDPRAWCEIALLHINIKACTHERRDGKDAITFYSGRKFYQPPEKAYALRYAFRVDAVRADYVAVSLAAPSGPLGTRDYRIVVEAVPLGAQGFVHVRYVYRASRVSGLASAGYLATLGRRKPGFTIVGRRPDGSPEYVGGARGAVERNAMRYYLAIRAYLDAPAPEQYAQRLARWYDLTERHPQLREIGRAEYLQGKARERAQQVARQQTLDVGAR